MLDRREFLKLSLSAGVAAAAIGCHRQIRSRLGPQLPARIELASKTGGEIFRLINRIGFGPRPGEVAEVEKLGASQYIARQLAAQEPLDAALQTELARLDIFHLDSAELRDLPENEMLRQLRQASLLRAVYDPNQLNERMVQFWSNHFNIFGRKGFDAWRLPANLVTVIRKHALGRFPDMLIESAHSPAMLEYLDNQANRVGTANENYARELMELHTLGVHGGYTQRDVQEVARCFTGWTIENRFFHARGRFRFDEDLHDNGEKQVLGKRIPAGGGIRDGERVLEILALHPATAQFIAGKICRHFLGPDCGDFVRSTAKVYLETRGDVRAMLKPILESNQLLESRPIPKLPFEYVVSALRALNANTDGGRPLQLHLERMGQPEHEWPMPDGFPYEAEAWTGSLLARWNFAAALLENQISGTTVDLDELQQHTNLPIKHAISEWTLGVRSESKQSVTTAEHGAFCCLASPAFQWRQ